MSQNTEDLIEPGTEVRIRSDPGRAGCVLKKTRQLDGVTYQQVRFSDGAQFLRPIDLEILSDEPEDPLELLSVGRFGRARDLRGLLTHVRLSGRLANLIYSMETTNTDFYPYQYKPVLNFLDSPSGGILIADEVGLGKTIEAGLIWTELRSRFDAKNLLVVCPAVLREKWRSELFHRFGVDADIVGAEEACRRLLEVKSGRRSSSHLIGSLQGLAPRSGWQDKAAGKDARSNFANLLSDSHYEDPLFDLVIIDEAHYLRNPETMGAELGRLLRGATQYIVLLSATPVHLKSRDLYQLVNLVDEATFNEPKVFDEILNANQPLLRSRDLLLSGPQRGEEISGLLEEAATHPFLRGNRQLTYVRKALEEYGLEDPERRANLAIRLEKLNLLGHAVTRTRKRDVTEFRVVREAVPELIEMHPREIAIYEQVTDIVRSFCDRRDAHEGFLLVTPQRQVASSMAAALEDWSLRAGLSNDDLLETLERDQVVPKETGPLVGELLAKARELGDSKELADIDTKYQRLSSMLTAYFVDHPTDKVVLFSTFKATLRYLHKRLSRDGIDSEPLMGGMKEEKHDVIARFKAKDGACVLLASEVASEGVDLQFSRLLVNYDLPWNPMKVEQRIGRIDRIGQKSPKITIWNLLHKDTIDERIYSRLYSRLGIFEQALGGLEAVLGEEVRSLSMDLMRGDVTTSQEEQRIEQTVNAVANLKKMESELEDKASSLVAHGDYILQHVRAARQMNRWITGADICAYVLHFLNKYYPGCDFRQLDSKTLIFDIRLSEAARFALETYLSEVRMRGSTALAINTTKPVRCEFKNSVSSSKVGKVEYISQFHPVVRFVGHELAKRNETFHPCVSARVSMREVPSVPIGNYAFVLDHWSVQGVRITEKINYVAASLSTDEDILSSEQSESLLTVTAIHGTDWISAEANIDSGGARRRVEYCLSRSISDYESFIVETEAENNDRADLQRASLQRHSKVQLERLGELLSRHRSKGQEKAEKLTQGRIRKLQETVDRKLEGIERNRKMGSNRREICVGVIRVE